MSPECLAQQPDLKVLQRGQKLPTEVVLKGDVWSGAITALVLCLGREYLDMRYVRDANGVAMKYFSLEAAARSLSAALQVCSTCQ